MARLLAIDWDHDHLQIVAVSASRKGVGVEKTLAWQLGEELTAANGEAQGRKLRDALKAAGIAAAPVVACVGRERVVVKELRYPPVPATEEPALVRFQAAKELSELPEDVVIDYARLSPPDQPGERLAMAVALRKNAALAWQALCRGLGVKLLAVTPRSHALLGAVERFQAEGIQVGGASAGDTLAVLALGERWAEFSIQNSGRVLFTRSLAAGGALANEIKRSLSVYAATNGVVPPPRALLITGKQDADLERRLGESVSLPVQRLQAVLERESVPAAQRGLLSAAIGAAHQWARSESLPINFAAPKQPRVAGDPNKSRKIFWIAAAVLLLAGGLVFGNQLLSNRKGRIRELTADKVQLEQEFTRLAQDRLDIAALKEWEETSISWLDELYDLTARLPQQIGFKLKELSVQPIAKRSAKENFVAQMSIAGQAKIGQDALLHQFVETLRADKHLRVTVPYLKDVGGNLEFQLKIDVARQPLDRYTSRFTAPKAKKQFTPGQFPGKFGPEGPGMQAEDPDDDGGEEGGVP